MVIVVVERVPVKLRGELSRWLLEPRAGVFVGTISALVRDKLWTLVCEACDSARSPGRKPGALLVYRARTEQGFIIRSHGDPSRHIVDYEGLTLVRVPHRETPGGEDSAALDAELTPDPTSDPRAEEALQKT